MIVCPECGGSRIDLDGRALCSNRLLSVDDDGTIWMDSSADYGNSEDEHWNCRTCGHDFPLTAEQAARMEWA